MSTVTLIIAGFIRKLSQQYSLSIPKDIIDIVLLFTPPILDFKGNTVALTYAEKAMIRSWFIEVLQLEENQCILTSKLLYDYEKNGKYGTAFYKHCLKGKNTFSIVRTNHNGHVFGCFLSKPLEKMSGSQRIKVMSDEKAFLCVIRSSFKNKGSELFKIKQRSVHNAYSCYNDCGPSFGVGFDLQVLSTYKNYCIHGDTCFQGNLIGNTLCGGQRYIADTAGHNFEVVNMTTFEINITE